MSALSLARRYRPMTFSEMLGQESVVTALANAIRLNRKPHGIIFSGVRGVGKTTLARLYAKALNCAQPENAPCNHCESCQAITAGVHEDVLEIDGASHTGVDDIRALQEGLDYVPQRSPYKVYIIDEVHMLSQSAFNALLKTLEEPPPHVVFLFATTELKKVPATIISRCQTYHLRLIPVSIVSAHLEAIVKKEGVPYEKGALEWIAREGRGSMRDSLTLLDQAIALTASNLRVELLRGLFATASSTTCLELLRGLVEKNAETILGVVASWDESGVALREAVEQTCELARHAFVVREIGQNALDTALLGLSPAEFESLSAVAAQAEALDLNRIFRTLVKCRIDLDGSALDRFILENYALEWCLDPGFPDLDDILAGGRVVSSPLEAATRPQTAKEPRTEKRAKDLKAEFRKTIEEAPAEAATPAPGAEKNPLRALAEKLAPDLQRPAAPQAPAATPAAPPVAIAFPANWRELVERWKQHKPLQARILEEAVNLRFEREAIHLAVDPNSMVASKLLDKDTQNRLKEQLRELFGFAGILNVFERKVEEAAPRGAFSEAGQSLLDIKRREKEEERQRLTDELAGHPATREALEAFSGKIGNIEFS